MERRAPQVGIDQDDPATALGQRDRQVADRGGRPLTRLGRRHHQNPHRVVPAEQELQAEEPVRLPFRRHRHQCCKLRQRRGGRARQRARDDARYRQLHQRLGVVGGPHAPVQVVPRGQNEDHHGQAQDEGRRRQLFRLAFADVRGRVQRPGGIDNGDRAAPADRIGRGLRLAETRRHPNMPLLRQVIPLHQGRELDVCACKAVHLPLEGPGASFERSQLRHEPILLRAEIAPALLEDGQLRIGGVADPLQQSALLLAEPGRGRFQLRFQLHHPRVRFRADASLQGEVLFQDSDLIPQLLGGGGLVALFDEPDHGRHAGDLRLDLPDLGFHLRELCLRSFPRLPDIGEPSQYTAELIGKRRDPPGGFVLLNGRLALLDLLQRLRLLVIQQANAFRYGVRAQVAIELDERGGEPIRQVGGHFRVTGRGPDAQDLGGHLLDLDQSLKL